MNSEAMNDQVHSIKMNFNNSEITKNIILAEKKALRF